MNIERMDGKTVAVSGGSSGVGLAVARGMARLGARTIVISRNDANGRHAVEAIRTATGSSQVEAISGSLTSAAGGEALAAALRERTDTLDVLVSSAGSYGETGVTPAGVPTAFSTNYLVHFELLRSTLRMLQQSPGSRALMVGVAPTLVKRVRDVPLTGIDPTSPTAALMTQSIAWKLLLARYFSDAFPAGPTVNAFHPGLIRSKLLATQAAPLRLMGSISNLFAKDHSAVAEYLASSASASGISGRNFDDRGLEIPSPDIITSENAATVWRASVEITK